MRALDDARKEMEPEKAANRVSRALMSKALGTAMTTLCDGDDTIVFSDNRVAWKGPLKVLYAYSKIMILEFSGRKNVKLSADRDKRYKRYELRSGNLGQDNPIALDEILLGPRENQNNHRKCEPLKVSEICAIETFIAATILKNDPRGFNKGFGEAQRQEI